MARKSNRSIVTVKNLKDLPSILVSKAEIKEIKKSMDKPAEVQKSKETPKGELKVEKIADATKVIEENRREQDSASKVVPVQDFNSVLFKDIVDVSLSKNLVLESGEAASRISSDLERELSSVDVSSVKDNVSKQEPQERENLYKEEKVTKYSSVDEEQRRNISAGAIMKVERTFVQDANPLSRQSGENLRRVDMIRTDSQGMGGGNEDQIYRTERVDTEQRMPWENRDDRIRKYK